MNIYPNFQKILFFLDELDEAHKDFDCLIWHISEGQSEFV